ncbi:MAG: hypothetical protein AAGE59_27785, partial [Cyanobacteria bacterium P01_F01_bin.86]
EIVSLRALRDTPTQGIEAANYEPFALLEFEVESGALLSKVSIYHPDSPNFVTQKYMFSNAWSRASRTS